MWKKKRMKKGRKDAQKHSINSVSIFNAFRFYMAFERIKIMKVYLLAKKLRKTKNISTDIHMSNKRTSSIVNLKPLHYKPFHRHNYISYIYLHKP